MSHVPGEIANTGRSHHHVVVLGASPKAERYANRAQRLLVSAGYRVTPVNPEYEKIETLAAVPTLNSIKETVDTLTLYLTPHRLDPLSNEILALAPGRVIFNPGSESRQLQDKLDAHGIPWLEACTLVMLSIGSF